MVHRLRPAVGWRGHLLLVPYHGGGPDRAGADGVDHGGERELHRADAGCGVSVEGVRVERRRPERLEHPRHDDGGVSQKVRDQRSEKVAMPRCSRRFAWMPPNTRFRLK